MSDSPLLIMAILLVMAIAVALVIYMTLKLNERVRDLAEDLDADRRNLAHFRLEVGRRLGPGPEPRGAAGSRSAQAGSSSSRAPQGSRDAGATARPAASGEGASASAAASARARTQAASGSRASRTAFADQPAHVRAAVRSESQAGSPSAASAASFSQDQTGYVPGSYRVPLMGQQVASPAARKRQAQQGTLSQRRAERQARAERRAAMAAGEYVPSRAELRAAVQVPRGQARQSWPSSASGAGVGVASQSSRPQGTQRHPGDISVSQTDEAAYPDPASHARHARP